MAKNLLSFYVGIDSVEDSHIQFANDTISPQTEELVKLDKVIELFSYVSSLNINLPKCYILSINCKEDKVIILANLYDCEVRSWSIK